MLKIIYFRLFVIGLLVTALFSCGSNTDKPSSNINSSDSIWRLIADSPASNGAFSYSVWAAADNDAFVADDIGRIYHYDGSRWSQMQSYLGAGVRDIWGLSGDNVYIAAGNNIYHYDGLSWELISADKDADVAWSIWGTSSNDLFVPGNGSVYHYDGSAWETMEIPGAFTLWKIWGAASDDVFAIGNKGTIFHYDGNEWTAMNSNTTANLYNIWGTASDDVYATGPKNILLHYDGSDWSSIEIDGYSYGIWGDSDDNIYVSTSTSLNLYNGSEWQKISSIGARDISGSGTRLFTVNFLVPENVLAEISIYENNQYSKQVFTTPSQTLSVSGSSRSNILLGGKYSLGQLYNGEEWLWMERSGVGQVQADLNFSWVLDENNIVAGSSEQIRHYDGNDWKLASTIRSAGFTDVWGLSTDNMFVTAAAGIVYQYSNSDGLTEMETPVSENLNGIWGFTNTNIYAVGNAGKILHYDGTDWSAETSPATQDLLSIWGSSPQDIYAIGILGSIVHYDGTDWTLVEIEVFSKISFRDIWGAAANDIYAVGNDTVAHYDGQNWSIIDTGYKNKIFVSIWGSDSENIFIADIKGAVYQYSK